MQTEKSILINIYMGENRLLLIPTIQHFYSYYISAYYYENIKELENYEEIGEAIQRCIQYIIDTPPSKATPKERKENAAWVKNTKYKSWKTFWKNNNRLMLDIINKDNSYRLSARKKTVDVGRGEYNDIYRDVILPSTTSYEDIAKKVVEMLKEVEEYYSDKSNIPVY